MHAHIHPHPHGLLCDYPKAPLPPLFGHCVPRWCRPLGNHCTESPFARRQVLPALRTGLKPVSPGITPALSLIQAHAPDRNPPSASGSPLCLESLQVAARPCWMSAFPSVISANLSLDAWTHTPVVPTGALTRFFPGDDGLHHAESGSALNNLSVPQLPYGVASRGYSHSLMFRPPGLLATHVAPTASRLYLSGQPWLLLPRLSRFVTSPSSGYANRPKSGN